MKRKVAGADQSAGDAVDLRRRHLRFGWWALLLFVTLGFVLETFHGFKVRFYLDGANATRRLMFTLAHAHGTLLALVNIVFGATIASAHPTERATSVASAALTLAAVLLPVGFFLGGVAPMGGDPGLGVLLVPLGAIALLVGVFLSARLAGRS